MKSPTITATKAATNTGVHAEFRTDSSQQNNLAEPPISTSFAGTKQLKSTADMSTKSATTARGATANSAPRFAPEVSLTLGGAGHSATLELETKDTLVQTLNRDTPATASCKMVAAHVHSRSQDDNDAEEARNRQDVEELLEQRFGSISPIFPEPSCSSRHGSLSSVGGGARATNLRLKFRKSHTCGSLFANCNCSVSAPGVPVPIRSGFAAREAPSMERMERRQPFAALPPTMQLSLSPSSADVSASSGLGASLHSNSTAAESSRWLSGGSFSLSTNTNTSIQLSRDDEDFDDASGSTWPSLVGETYANSAHTASEESSRKSRAPRISTPTSLEVPAVSFSGSYASLPRSSSSSSNAQRKSRRLFQSYSHPDTDFVFTDENKKPSSDTIVLAHQQNTTAAPTASPSLEAVITSRDGRIARRHPKRSSSPNIGEYQTLDVAVHPDLLVKISPRHSPARSDRQHTGTPTSTAAAALSARSAAHQRRRWLQRSKEIESGGSTSDSEISADVKSPLSADLSQSEKVAQPHNDGEPLKDSNLVKDETLNAAQRYFVESGILGPINPSNNLIRKTSKILQDSNVIEKIRKTSLILRGNQRKTSSTTTTTTTSYPSSTTQLNSPLLSCNDNNMELPTSIIYAQPTNSPKSPRSPHTVATTEFSPNLTTQSCCNMDDRDTVIKSLHGEMVSLKDVIKSRDAEILKLRREIHKLKSVLQQTTNHIPIAHDELLQSPTENKNRFQLSTQCRMVSSSSSSEGDQNMRLSSTCTSCHRKLQPDDKIGDSNGSVSLDSTSDYITCSSTDSIPNNKANKQSANSEESNYNSTTKSSTKSASWTLAASNGSPHSSTEVASDAPVTKVTIISSNIVAKPKFLNLTAAPVLKKQGVSGESCETSMQQSINEPIPKFEKDFSSKQLIKDAIMDNDFLKNIDVSQVRELVESMYSLSVAKGEFVIREGEVGAHLYVSAEGEFEVVKNDKVLGIMGPGKAFGELAILYNCTRTASVRVLSDAQLWVLDRRVFQQIMMRTGMQRIENSVNFLKSVPLLKNLSEEVLAKIADVLEVEFYPAGTYIIRQGASGDTFFLISQGSVQVTQKLGLTGVEKEIRRLERGDYFGEQALINEDKRTANIIALAPGVECLTLDRESFTHLIGDLSELKEKSYDDESRIMAMKHADTREIFGANVKPEFPDMKLTDLEVVATLGLGGFGRVELVKAYHENHVETFALKCLKKRHIVDTKQEDHIFSERTIMLSCNSPFICRLYRTFRDEKYVYMLLEACMGGEIWTTLRDRGCFDENATQFIVGCVLQAFEYLHSRGIIYRDLKPENLMFNERGYVKLVDFGFSKYIGNSSKTWTFCGTPEYVAPEIILNKGHDRAVDYWALGILMHELLNGTPPFTSNDPMKTYNIILKGIDMIDFPKHMSRAAVQLIKKLCRDVPAERLGYQKGGIQDIKKHKWFLGFDWDGLQNQLLISPFVRPIAHPTDTCYFDRFPCDPNEPPDELSGWDADF